MMLKQPRFCPSCFALRQHFEFYLGEAVCSGCRPREEQKPSAERRTPK